MYITHDPGRAARTTDGAETFSVALLQISYYRPPLQTDRQLGRHQKLGAGGGGSGGGGGERLLLLLGLKTA